MSVEARIISHGPADKVAAICVGGPFDGQKIVHPGPIFCYLLNDDFVSYWGGKADQHARTKQQRYLAHSICGVPVWVHETLSLSKAVEALVNAYDVPPHLRARPSAGG